MGSDGQITWHCLKWNLTKLIENCNSAVLSHSYIDVLSPGRVARVGGDTGFTHAVNIGHFHRHEADALDQGFGFMPAIGWILQVEPEDHMSKSAFMLRMHITKGTVPANSVVTFQTSCLLSQAVTLHVTKLMLHTHEAGQRFVIWKTTPDGHEQVLMIEEHPNINYNVPDISDKKERIDPGDRISFACTMNNTKSHPIQIGYATHCH